MKAKSDLPKLNLELVDMSAKEKYLHAVEEFSLSSPDPFSDDLEKYLLYVAQTGNILTDWKKVQTIFIHKLGLVLDEFFKANPYVPGKVNPNCENANFDDMKNRLINLASEFDKPPFTFQRLCELVTSPRKNYAKCEKFLRAIEKNLMVVSPWTYSSSTGTEKVEEVNGSFDSRSSLGVVEKPWTNLPPSPVTTAAPRLPAGSSLQGANTVSQNDVVTSGDVATGADVTDLEAQSRRSDVSAAADTKKTQGDSSGCDVARPAADVSEEDGSDIKKATDAVDDDAMEISAPEGTADETSPNDSSRADQSPAHPTNSDVTIPAITAQSDCTSPDLSKLERKESLPGVGTLVEKHSVNRFVTKQGKADEGSKDDAKSGALESQLAAGDVTPVTSSCGDVSLPSPKRKLSTDDDVQMDVSSPTKRAKSDVDVIKNNLT